jgi:hypothetical protein
MKQQNSVEQNGTKRSAQSQSSVIAERILRDNIGNIDLAIRQAEDQVLELEAQKAELTKRQGADPRRAEPQKLGQTIAEIGTTRAIIEAYKGHRAETQLQIEKRSPTPGQVQARLAAQQEFAKHAQGRFQLDSRIDQLFAQFRSIVSERADLTDKMAKCAELLDLTFLDDGLDARLNERLALLAEKVSVPSRTWCDSFLGRQRDCTPYVVIDESLTLRETLLDHGIYSFGEKVFLTAKEAREHLRNDRPVKNRRYPWECQRPSVMTIEAYQKAVAAAKETGTSVAEILNRMGNEFEEEARKEFQAKEALRLKEARELVATRDR